MNKILLPLLSGLAAQSAHATTFCMDLSVLNQSRTELAHARCSIDQSTRVSLLNGDWTCSFNQGPVQTKTMLATWITDPKPEQAATLTYMVQPGIEIGDFLFQGMNLKITTGATLQVILGDVPTVKYNNASVTDGDWKTLDLKATQMSYGACQF